MLTRRTFFALLALPLSTLADPAKDKVAFRATIREKVQGGLVCEVWSSLYGGSKHIGKSVFVHGHPDEKELVDKDGINVEVESIGHYKWGSQTLSAWKVVKLVPALEER